MDEEFRSRLNGLESIIHSLHHNNGLLKFMSFNLHKEPFNLFNNHGLYWIWVNIMGTQLLDFYKTIGKNEKYSFVKLTNVAREKKIKVDYESLESMTNHLIDSYEKTDFETVRSKYLAHQDVNVPEIKTDLISLDKFTQILDGCFTIFSKEFGIERAIVSNDIVDSFSLIFSTIDEYEKIKGYLVAVQIQGNTTVEISHLKKLLND